MRSFPFFIKERNVFCVLFDFISHTKIANLTKKERKRAQHSFHKVKKERSVETRMVGSEQTMFSNIIGAFTISVWRIITQAYGDLLGSPQFNFFVFNRDIELLISQNLVFIIFDPWNFLKIVIFKGAF